MTTNLTVNGMTCGSCVRHIERALLPLPGVTRVEVDLRARRVAVDHDGRAPTTALIHAIAAAGYDVEPPAAGG